MNEIINNSNEENDLINNPLTKSTQESSKDKLTLKFPNLKSTKLVLSKLNDTNSIPLLNSKLPPIKSNLIRKTSTSDNNSRLNNLNFNYLTIKSQIDNNSPTNINNNNYISTYTSSNDLNKNNSLSYNKYNNNLKSELNIIKDENEKVSHNNIHIRNLELIKQLAEKRKKQSENKADILNKNCKTPMERLDLFKKSLIHNGISLIKHKKLEPLKLNEPKIINYYYQIIHEGNRSETIEECLKRRGHWKKYNNEEIHNVNNKNLYNISPTNSNFTENNVYNYNDNYYLPNFLWSHCSSKINFNEYNRGRPGEAKKITNHFEFHKEITNKLNLFINMMNFCENDKHNLFSILPMTFPIKYESKYYLLKMDSFIKIFNNIDKYISDKHLDYKYRDLFQLEMKGRIGYRTSFHIPKNHYCGRNLWLVKAIDLNRGRCIRISDNIKEIEKIIKNFYRGVKKDFDKGEENIEIIKVENKIELPTLNNNKINLPTNSNIIKVNSSHNLDNKEDFITKRLNNKKVKSKGNNKQNYSQSPKNIRENIINTYKQYKLYNKDPNTYQNSSVIIQKYIEKPLCYKGRKCDMRLWVLLNWDFNVYLFKEGHFKATSVPYDVNSQNSYVHLTNYSVQKYNQDFEKFESGNEISFTDFELSLNNEINVKKDLLPKVKEIIIYTMKCAKNKINKGDRKLCFEIFGYDFMFDIEYKPYLLEINTNPGLEISSPLIEMLIPRLIDDAFKLTIDKIFLINQDNLENMKKNPLKVGGYDDDENMWELLGNVLN